MTDHFAEALITFRDLLDEARSAGDPEPTAMSLATVDWDGQPTCRTVLLRTSMNAVSCSNQHRKSQRPAAA